MREIERHAMKGTFWAIGTNINDYPLGCDQRLPVMICYNDELKSLARMRTRLNCFSDREQGALINWGYALADAALRSVLLRSSISDHFPARHNRWKARQ
jgi:NTE family protein